MIAPVKDSWHGCSDSEKASLEMEMRLSRIYDFLYSAYEIGGADFKQTVWTLLPAKDKMDFNWRHWRYI